MARANHANPRVSITGHYYYTRSGSRARCPVSQGLAYTVRPHWPVFIGASVGWWFGADLAATFPSEQLWLHMQLTATCTTE